MNLLRFTIYDCRAFMLAPHVNQRAVDCLNTAIEQNQDQMFSHMDKYRNKQLDIHERCRLARYSTVLRV